MPFPWKRIKFSQLLADRINSSKKGKPLIIQTGFPTSLVDLFHKNRNRLKKFTKKKRSKAKKRIGPTLPDDSALSNSSLKSANADNSWTMKLDNAGEFSMKLANDDDFSMKLANADDNCSIKSANTDTCSMKSANANNCLIKCANEDKCSMKLARADSCSIFKNNCSVKIASSKESEVLGKVILSVLKIFFVVVSGLGTNSLLVGVSMSTFCLVFLEYIGKFLNNLWRPCLNSIKMDKKVLCFIGMVANDLKRIDSDCCGSVMGYNSDVPSIRMVQHEPNLNPKVSQIMDVDCKKKLELKEMESSKVVLDNEDGKCEDLGLKRKGAGKAKMRSKMKKLVSKKLWKSKKKQAGSKSEASDSSVNSEANDLVEEDFNTEKGYDYEPDCLDEGTSYATFDSFEPFQNESEATAVGAKVSKGTKGTLGYWVLCLILLAGLVGGRSLAVGVTLFWCLIFKLMKYRRNCSKLPC